MYIQNQILRTLSRPSSLPRLRQLATDQPVESRAALARATCEAFNFRDACGRLQETNCSRALSMLAERGLVALPEARPLLPRSGHVRTLPEPVPQPSGLPEQVQDIDGLSISLVTEREQLVLWNTLLAEEHPRGVSRFLGAQRKYLIHSEHGYLGALGFSASCLRLACRDIWMGWSDVERKRHLHRVLCLSRLLIRGPCRNLASHVLGQVLRRMGADFEACYGYRPWIIETFVDAERTGSCFKAANFRYIGQSSGKKRHPEDEPRTPKAVFVYELAPSWRKELQAHTISTLPVRQPEEGLSEWVSGEFGGAPFGDRRLSVRLEKTAAMLNDVLGEGIARHTDYKLADVRGCYRLLSKEADSPVTLENILSPHRARTLERMRSQKVVLCVQDGSHLNYDTKLTCKGLQVIGSNQMGVQLRGLHLHVTLATTEYGVPLGVLRCSTKHPDTGPLKPKMQSWLDGYADICEAAEALPADTCVVCVMDREADCFALFDAQRQAGRVEMLVRVKHNRILESGERLINQLAQEPPACEIRLDLRRLSKRKKAKGRPQRTAHLEIRFARITMRSQRKRRPPLSMYEVSVTEPNPPDDDTEPINWTLLTSIKVETANDALRVVSYYVRRWRMEEFFCVLKNGCRVEKLSLRKAERLSRAIAIYCVLAWRVMLLTLLGREAPDLPAEVFFTNAELRFFERYAKSFRRPPP